MNALFEVQSQVGCMKENEIDMMGSYQAVIRVTSHLWFMVRGIFLAYSRQGADSTRSWVTNACLAAWRFPAVSWASWAVLGSSQMLVALYSPWWPKIIY